MKAYEFSTKVTLDGKLIIPEPYSKDIPAGDSVRVIVLINEEIWSVPKETSELPASPALTKIIKEIKHSPQNPANIQAASGLLAEHLASSPETPDPLFDVAAWNRQWADIEAEMKRLKQENWR